ncbi:MAG: DUF362 domain-containing protein [Dehalococcoidales bacterium]|nr:DUF362 domain-containing protein [Dehalococcoidales bacterium]
MIFETEKFVFDPPPAVSVARRVLIKPDAGTLSPYPATTSRELLATIIEGIRRVSDADIIVLEGTVDGSPVTPIYSKLGYDFPRVLMLDVKDCIWVEVDNPLPKPLAVPAFWIPNVILSSDYLISVTPLKISRGKGKLSIPNLMSLLPIQKYSEVEGGWEAFCALGIDKIIADLYFTLPFDMGIIEADQELICDDKPSKGKSEKIGKIFIGDPLQVDKEASETLGIKADYLHLIKLAESGIDTI